MRICLAFAVASLAAVGQQPAWEALRKNSPPGVGIFLAGTSRVFREGEAFRATVRVSVMQDREAAAEQWQFAGLLLDPAPPDGCGRIDAPCFASQQMGFSKFEPTETLNNYLPKLRPGTYRIALLLRKLVRILPAPMVATYGYPTPPVYAASSPVTFKIVAADEAWRTATLAGSLKAIRTKAARNAAEQIRALDTPASWRASLAVLPLEENTLLQGLTGTGHPRPVCKLMEDAIPKPTQAVSFSYLDALTHVCARANLPAQPKYVPPKPQQIPAPTPAQAAWQKRRMEYDAEVRNRATAALAASLPRKTDAVRVVALQTLVQALQASRANNTAPPYPAWTPLFQQEFRKACSKVNPWELSLYVELFRSPDVVAMLETLLDAWKPGDYYESPHTALRLLNNIDPSRGQARIAAELLKEKTWLDLPQLDMLPASAVKVSDNTLIEALAAAQRSGGWNPQLRMAALARYASAKALPRIKAIYESQSDPCQPELMAYFVRVDPAYANRVFRAEPWDMQGPPPQCTVQYFTRTPRIAYGPVLERYLLAYLNHNDVNLKKNAAESLARYGSTGAATALWEMLRYFHGYWSPRQTELAQNQQGLFLETAIRDALARAQGWFLGEADLRLLRTLCLTVRCRYETDQDLQRWTRPVRIGFWSARGDFRGEVAQYHGILSIEALEWKLAQFPKGTSLLLTLRKGIDDERMAARIGAFAAGRGLTIVSR